MRGYADSYPSTASAREIRAIRIRKTIHSYPYEPQTFYGRSRELPAALSCRFVAEFSNPDVTRMKEVCEKVSFSDPLLVFCALFLAEICALSSVLSVHR